MHHTLDALVVWAQGKIDQLQENSKGLQKQNKDLKDDLKLVEAEQIQLSHKTKILEEQQQVLCAEKEDLAKQVRACMCAWPPPVRPESS